MTKGGRKDKKPNIAFFSLTCCEGCEFAVLDLHERFFELTNKINIKEFHLIEEEEPRFDHYDISFVEGTALTEENLSVLKRARKASDILVALGNCAHLGGVHDIKNWIDKEKAIRYVYPQFKSVENPDVKPIGEIVDVDYVIPGCPINGEEFLEVVYDLLAGKKPQTSKKPVCYECQTAGYECLLQKGQPCLGPITVGGCRAVCLASKQPCFGCRGLVEEGNEKSLIELLKKEHTIDTVNKIAEVFGVRGELNKRLNKKNKK